MKIKKISVGTAKDFVRHYHYAVISPSKSRPSGADNSRKTQSAICMPLCLKHDCPRPCPICDKDNPNFKAD